MLKFCDDFGVKYTGLIIEDYTEEIDGIFRASRTRSGSIILARCCSTTAAK